MATEFPQSPTRFTVEAYLEIDRAAEERYEYLDGEIYAMAGESPEHGTICMNLSIMIGSQLRGTPCQAFAKDTKVRSGAQPCPDASGQGLFSYPDLVVVCGPMQFHDDVRDILLNPTLIIEVLSPSTERFDRGEKFQRYRTWLPTLQDYLLVAQDKPQIDHYHRVGPQRWDLLCVEGLQESIHLAALHCTCHWWMCMIALYFVLNKAYDDYSAPFCNVYAVSCAQHARSTWNQAEARPAKKAIPLVGRASARQWGAGHGRSYLYANEAHYLAFPTINVSKHPYRLMLDTS